MRYIFAIYADHVTTLFIQRWSAGTKKRKKKVRAAIPNIQIRLRSQNIQQDRTNLIFPGIQRMWDLVFSLYVSICVYICRFWRCPSHNRPLDTLAHYKRTVLTLLCFCVLSICSHQHFVIHPSSSPLMHCVCVCVYACDLNVIYSIVAYALLN